MMMPSKERFTALIMMMLFLGLSFFQGCEQKREENKSPKEVLSAYLDAVIGGRMEEAYQNLSSVDRAEKSLQVFIPEKSEEESFIRSAIAKKIAYTIKDVTVTGDRAKAFVDITAPDFDTMVKDIFSSLSAKEFPKGNLEAHSYVSSLVGRYVKKCREKGIPMKTSAEHFDLIEEAGVWKVALHEGKGR
jgi:hypothetical protein